MILEIYTIYDSATQAYGRPFFLASKGEALRFAIQVSEDPNMLIGRFPDQFTLFRIGQYDDQSAYIDQLETRERIVGFHELKKEGAE